VFGLLNGWGAGELFFEQALGVELFEEALEGDTG
jgi:hypothetical protein